MPRFRCWYSFRTESRKGAPQSSQITLTVGADAVATFEKYD
jgi:hypothetical protein